MLGGEWQDIIKMVEEKNFAFSVGPECFKESNLSLLQPRFHKSGLELPRKECLLFRNC